jgi:preprotein translocase subunit SecG
MLTFLTVFHLLVSLVLILFVLLQDPKGGGAMGVFGGGGSSSLLGSTGASNFFTQVTKGAAILFAVLCVGMTYIISHKGTSVLDNTSPVSAPATAPADSVPADTPAEKAPPVDPAAPAQAPETK